jgi:hypothetical protein
MKSFIKMVLTLILNTINTIYKSVMSKRLIKMLKGIMHKPLMHDAF